MFCSKCGKENEDSAVICHECGCSLVGDMTETNNKKRSVWSIVGMCVGAVIVICGIILIITQPVVSQTPKYIEFGADFYTESYNATRVAAMNIGNAAKAVVKGLGFVTASIGAFMTVYFGRAAFEKE